MSEKMPLNDSVFPVGWTCKNLASQPKKKTKRQEKTKGKSHLRQCFGEMLHEKYLKNTRFMKNVVFFFSKDARKPSQPSTGNTESICDSLNLCCRGEALHLTSDLTLSHTGKASQLTMT